MQAGQVLVWSRRVVLGAIGGVLFQIPAYGQQIIVGPNIHVSGAREHSPHSEVFVAADPDDRDHLLGCAIILSQERNASSTIVYISRDRGKSWAPTLHIQDTDFSSDPNCTVGRNGRAYFVTVSRQTRGSMSSHDISLKLYSSTNGGESWSKPVTLPYLDRESIVIDDTKGRYDGQVYINGWGGVGDLEGRNYKTGLALVRSADEGATFLGPALRIVVGDGYLDTMGNCVVLSEGTLACLVGESKDHAPVETQLNSERLKSSLELVTSRDGGRSFEDATIVSDYVLLRKPPGTTNVIPCLAVDPGSPFFRDRLYAAWQDVSSGRVQILFAYSSDGGKTWAEPRVIDDDQPFNVLDPAAGPDDFMPTLAVNRSGVVGIMWYDRRDNPDNLGWHVRFRASLDGGETFGPSVRISEAPSRFGKRERWPVYYWQPVAGGGTPQASGGLLRLTFEIEGQHFNGGDYAGMAADAGGDFHPFWVDNRTGIPQVWTADIAVKGKVSPNGSVQTDLADVTDKVTFNLTNISYDRGTETLSVDLQLKNTSNQTLRSPFQVRVIKLSSGVGGQVELDGGSGHAEGTVWDFSDQVLNGTLRPGDLSARKRFTVHLSSLRPLRRGRDINLNLANVQLRVFGKAVAGPP